MRENLFTCFIGLGSNIGNREGYIVKAIGLLRKHSQISIEKKSCLIETEPQGGPPQDKFLNGVLKIKTSLTPQELLNFLQDIEKELGRIRSIRNGPRQIDLDILLYADKEVKDENLHIPHPRMCERSFVIKPLLEIEPHIFDRLKILRPLKNKIQNLIS